MDEPARTPEPSENAAGAPANAAAARPRGRLKIFFGACAGVGKTYAMLQAAQWMKQDGVDVVIGVLETHGWPETAALATGLDALPSRKVEYRGAQIQEFDLDAAIVRRPQLIVVDELAHANAPNCRHAKR